MSKIRAILLISIVAFLTLPCIASTGILVDSNLQPDTSFHFSGKLDIIHIIDSFALASLNQELLLLKLNNVSGIFENISNLSLGTDVTSIKVYDTVAVILTVVDIIFFVDISSLPVLTLLGEADLPYPFYDYALNNQDLYIASGFDGLQRYKLTNFNSPNFVDSSMIGVHCIQVDIFGNELLLLDDYNGILKYDLTIEGLGGVASFDKYLYIPRQARSFVRQDSILVMTLANSFKIYFASSDSLENGITDSLSLLNQADEIISYSEYLITVNYYNNQIEIIRPIGISHLIVPLPGTFTLSPTGSIYSWNNDTWFVLTSDSTGPIRYNLTDILFDRQPHQAYFRPGEITSLVFHKARLYTGGEASFLDSYSFDSLGQPSSNYSLTNLQDIKAIEPARDILLVLYPTLNSILGISSNSDSLSIEFSIPIDGHSVQALHYNDINPNDTLGGLFITRGSELDIYTVSEKWDIRPVSIARTLSDINNILIVDTLLILTTSNNLIYGYRIYDDYSVISLWSLAAVGQVDEIISTGSRQDSTGLSLPEMILAFIDRDMYELDISNPGQPSIVYLNPIINDVLTTTIVPNSGAFTVGDFGIGWLDFHIATPELTSLGGNSGDMITFDLTLSLLATSNGNKIDLFQIDRNSITATPAIQTGISQTNILVANYPNPFNPSTTIEYTLPAETRVRLVIHDLIGRTVTTLVDNILPSGTHQTAWTGRDSNGNRVASGIYFYRLTTEKATETRKMILLK